MRAGSWFLGIALGGTFLIGACLMTIDESRIPGTSIDAGPSNVVLGCGDAACTLANAVCCASTYSDRDYKNGYCTIKGDCQTGDYFTCERTSDCRSGDVCCVVYDHTAFTRSECARSCATTVLCNPGEGQCPAGQSCRMSQGFPGLGECI
jgi:hypothetical protein